MLRALTPKDDFLLSYCVGPIVTRDLLLFQNHTCSVVLTIIQVPAVKHCQTEKQHWNQSICGLLVISGSFSQSPTIYIQKIVRQSSICCLKCSVMFHLETMCPFYHDVNCLHINTTSSQNTGVASFANITDFTLDQ